VGKGRRRNRARIDVVPTRTLLQAVRQWEDSTGAPHVPYLRTSKGESIRVGSRLRKFGLTPEETYQQYAPEGTAPERLLFGWLARHDVWFSYQVKELGGRLPGGAIIDFVIWEKTPYLVIRVMSYWHDNPESQSRDMLQRLALEELGYWVEDVRESEINTVEKVDATMRTLLYAAPRRTGLDVVVISRRCPFCGDPYCVLHNFRG